MKLCILCGRNVAIPCSVDSRRCYVGSNAGAKRSDAAKNKNRQRYAEIDRKLGELKEIRAKRHIARTFLSGHFHARPT